MSEHEVRANHERSERATKADWYPDPSGAAELRYWDGAVWTEHVANAGVVSQAPIEPPPRSRRTTQLRARPPRVEKIPGAQRYVVTRTGQPRDEGEASLEINGPDGPYGRFDPVLDGAPGYVLVGRDGQNQLRVTKPSLKAAVQVEQPFSQPVGTIAKVGRLHSRYDVHGPDGADVGALRLAPDGEGWELRDKDGVLGAKVDRSVLVPPGPTRLGGVRYDVAVAPDGNEVLRGLALALPVAIDVLDTQVS